MHARESLLRPPQLLFGTAHDRLTALDRLGMTLQYRWNVGPGCARPVVQFRFPRGQHLLPPIQVLIASIRRIFSIVGDPLTLVSGSISLIGHPLPLASRLIPLVRPPRPLIE